jgi:hypothetical protein
MMRKMRKTIWLVLFCAIGAFGYAQDSVYRRSVSLVLSPATLRAPGIKLGLQAGVQYNKGRWATLAEVAYPLDKSHADYAVIRFVRLGAEVKYYVHNGQRERGYVSLQSSYSHRKMTDNNGNMFFSKTARQWLQFNSAAVSSPIFSAALKAGVEYALTRRLFLEYFVGAGVRVISTSYSGLQGLRESGGPSRTDWGDFTPPYRYEGSYPKFHLTLGLRVGYVLKR